MSWQTATLRAAVVVTPQRGGDGSVGCYLQQSFDYVPQGLPDEFGVVHLKVDETLVLDLILLTELLQRLPKKRAFV